MNFPAPVALRDVPAGEHFVFADGVSSPTDYTRIWRRVSPIKPDGTGGVLFGIPYQPSDDANSCWMVDAIHGHLARCLAGTKVIIVEQDVALMLRVRNVWRY